MDATSIASRPRAARLSETPIAIIGMSAILPESENLSRYWQNIVDELDCIRDVPPDRWKIADLYDPDSKAPDKTYSKRGGFIPEIAFDPMEFGLPPNILEVTDVSQLLALVAAREVLKDAGYADEKSFDRDRMGVTLGVGGGQKLYTPLTSRLQYPIWKEVLVKSGVSEAEAEIIISKIKKAHIPWEENSFPGMLGNVIAGRVANRFNLGGTNCVLDAACGGALAAVKMAVSELVEHRADIMITGGVDTDNSPFMYLCFSKTPAMTPDEYCSPFDEGSRGILISEGIGMLALKRLADAERDGDRVYAVIRGLGTSSDGKFKSIYAPRPEGQAKALRRAYQDADISPNTLGLIEAHATGTPAGDLSEFTALKQVFGECGAEMQSIAVGSVKSQIGHTKTAAGAAGLIKAALALHHKVLPATLHVSRPNPKLDVPNSPFYVNTETRPWVRSNGTPRRAGVSAFGFGGTNFHFVLEEYEKAAEKPFRIHGKNRAALICADTPQILLNRMNDLAARLSSPEGERAFSDLWQASRSLSIPPDSARVGLVADSAKKAAELLCAAVKALSESPEKEAFSLPQGVHYRVRALSAKVCALFSGQGSQYVNMGRGAALSFPPVHEMFGKADHLFSEHGLAPLSEAVYPRPVFSNDEKSALERALSGTRLAQPAIGALSAGFFEVFRKAGFSPDFFAGHSFGELSALWAAGAISLDDFLNLARIRGEAMALAPKPGHDPGKMAAILASASDIAEICALFPNVVTANYNGPRQTVIAGPTPDLDACCEMLSGRGFKAVPLPVSAAFHSPCVAHAKEPFAQAVSAVSFNENCARVFSNTLAGPYPKNPEEAKRLLCNHILNPVRFTDEVEAMYAAGARIFVEFGPRDILKRMVSDILGARPHLALAVDARGRDGDAALREAWAAMKVAGLPLADADPWAAPPDQQEAKPGRAAVRLTGANYVSEKTRKAYQDSVNDGFTVGAAKKAGEGKDRKMEAYADTVTSKALNNAVFTTLPPHGTQPPCPAASPPVRDTAAQQVFQSSAAPAVSTPAVEHIPGVNSAMPLSRLENVLDQFISHQRQTTGAHEKFLDNNSEYIKAVFGLLSDQAALLSKNGNGSNVPDVLSRGMDAFHGVWADTVRVHGRFLEEESNNGRLWLYAASGQDARTAPVARALPTQQIPAISARAGSLPAPMASPMREPEMPAAPKAAPAPMFIREAKAAPAPSSAPEVLFPVSPKLKAAQPEPPKAPTPSTPAPVADLSGAFLEVVSEKTGYPVSMLELSMDMEADLGIDSIKRVEILGAMRERFPHLPELEAAELAELKTLGQVASRLTQSVAGTPELRPDSHNLSPSCPEADLSGAFLEVVSEKTGYPVSMLELSMDMEADLGIDSIKRVEILGAMRERFPHLPELEAAELAELKTLGQVASRLTQSVAGTPELRPDSHNLSPSCPEADLSGAFLEVVSEKTGYPVSMLELSMDMEADLGIDSIKRVEILGAMRERFPHLPELEAAELAELKTLGQVASRLSGGVTDAPGKLSVPTPSPAPSEMKSASLPENLVSVAVVRELPSPDRIFPDFPQGGIVIVSDDGTGLAGALGASLEGLGLAPVILSCAPPVNGKRRIEWNGESEDDLAQIIAGLAGNGGIISGCVFAMPPDRAKSTYGPMSAFLLAKHLAPFLNIKDTAGRRFFVTVSRMDGYLGTGGADFDSIHGSLSGLAKTAGLEWENVFCRAIDIEPGLDLSLEAEFISGEILDPDLRITETGRGTRGRMTLDFRPAVLSDTASMPAPENPVFLVSGGARGVTAACVTALAQKWGGRYILAGRSQHFTTEPDWAQNASSEGQLKEAAVRHLQGTGEKPSPKAVTALVREVSASREISRTLSEIRRAGGEAIYIKADATDPAALASALAPITAETGPITGLIHGAGVIHDKPLHQKDAADFIKVFKTKTDGLAALMNCVDPASLTHLVMFSSAAGFFGNPGQCDYSMANEALNKAALAFSKKHPGCRVVSFNWGPIDGGMVGPELKRHFEKRGVDVVPLAHCTEIFTRALSGGNETGIQLLVGSSMQEADSNREIVGEHRAVATFGLAAAPFLADHAIGEKPVLPTVCAISVLAEACERLYPGFHAAKVSDYRLFTGVTLDPSKNSALEVSVRQTSKNGNGLAFDVSVTGTNGKKGVNHYGATVKLLPGRPEPPTYLHFVSIPQNAENGTVFYQDKTLFHGPRFRVVEKVIHRSEKKLTALCRAPRVCASELGRFATDSMNPFAADALLQCLLVWIRRTLSLPSLPTAAACVENFRPVKPGDAFYVSLDVTRAELPTVTADITAHDADGLVLFRISGAQATASESLNKHF